MSDFEFEGFEPANTTPVPDILFDILLSKLSGAEVKVLLYIIRRTWGFKKQTDAISLSQLQNGITTREGKVLDLGCGIKRRETICEALASLEKKKCIFSRKEKTSYKDNATTVYGIYFKQGVVSKPDYPTEETKRGSFKTGLPVVSKPDQGSPVSGPGVVSKPDPQETVIQLDSYQETVIQGSTNSRASIDDATPTRSQLEEQIASLQAQLDQYKQTLSPQATEGERNSPSIADTPDHNAILSPLISATDALVQDDPTTTYPENTPSESQRSATEMPSSVPAHDESSNQAAEQASDTSPIATSTTNNLLPVNDATKPPQSEPVQPATQKPRGRGKSAAAKEEKPQLSDEEKAKEAQYAERRRLWQKKINERRGGPLRTRGLCINETECLNTLVREFDDIDIGKIDRHLATEHWKYKKNPAEIGGKALLDESRPTLQYLKTKGGQSSNGSSQQTPTPIKASMTHDEACKLTHDAIEQAKQYNIVVVAQAVSSKNNPDAWMVRVKWDDGSKDGFPFPPIKVREQWDSTLTEIRKIIKEESKQAARSVARMQEVR